MSNHFRFAALVGGLVLMSLAQAARGQGFGTDNQNVLAPAAGGMAGASLALPQDVPAAIFGNPATLTQFHGTQFTLGGAWVEGYPTVSNNGSLNAGEPFSVTSRTQGFAVPEIGVTQDLRPIGVPGDIRIGVCRSQRLGGGVSRSGARRQLSQ